MVRSKKQFRCHVCQATQISWEGACRACGVIDSLKEEIIIPTGPKPRMTSEAARLRRRSKGAERDIARRMVAVDGADPAFSSIASSTGRIGHITNLQVDAISLSYVTEEKNRKIPTWMATAWLVINQRSIDFHKNALLHITPPNIAKDFVLNGQKYKLDNLAIISQTRHEDLIRKEKALARVCEMLNEEKDVEILQTIFEALQENKKQV